MFYVYFICVVHCFVILFDSVRSRWDWLIGIQFSFLFKRGMNKLKLSIFVFVRTHCENIAVLVSRYLLCNTKKKKWSPVDAVHTINLGFDQPCKICITLEISKSSWKSEMIIHFLQMWNEKRPGMLDKCNIYNVNSNQSLFSKHWTNPKYTATACMMVVGFGWHLWRNVHCFPVLAWEINLLAITNLYITCCLY